MGNTVWPSTPSLTKGDVQYLPPDSMNEVMAGKTDLKVVGLENEVPPERPEREKWEIKTVSATGLDIRPKSKLLDVGHPLPNSRNPSILQSRLCPRSRSGSYMSHVSHYLVLYWPRLIMESDLLIQCAGEYFEPQLAWSRVRWWSHAGGWVRRKRGRIRAWGTSWVRHFLH